MVSMGLDYGLQQTGKFCKRPFRYIFRIDGVSADPSPGVDALPPQKSARPNISFKEAEVNHLIEDVYFPVKPEWKPITLTLYDLQRNKHPVFKWLEEIYQPSKGEFFAPNVNRFIKTAGLYLLDGCGTTIETWFYEDVWPQAINFQTLDMSDTSVLMCELTLRYARAYVA